MSAVRACHVCTATLPQGSRRVCTNCETAYDWGIPGPWVDLSSHQRNVLRTFGETPVDAVPRMTGTADRLFGGVRIDLTVNSLRVLTMGVGMLADFAEMVARVLAAATLMKLEHDAREYRALIAERDGLRLKLREKEDDERMLRLANMSGNEVK